MARILERSEVEKQLKSINWEYVFTWLFYYSWGTWLCILKS